MINVLFCGNDKVFDGVLTCALSILKRTQTKEPFTFYLYTLDLTNLNPAFRAISKQSASFLGEVVKDYNSDNRVVLIDVKDVYDKELAGSPNEASSYSPYAMLRVLADLIENMPSKLLYLDADILLNRDIRLLYDINVEDYEYAAARDHYGKYLVNPNYINSGVLLLNLERIKKTGLFSKARGELRKRKLAFPDQTAIRINTVKKKMLPQKFNDQKFLHKSTVVRHFSKRLFWLPYPHTANVKQWQVSLVHKIFGYYEFDDILYEYLYLKEKFNREVAKHE
ncbi:MAG: lipopolysaccharide biosynthesis protein [Ruminococcaceae bacterium]|nr:lipopolysaccharide biosynthesis protein [Oscillospiraceae bacterium]